MGSVGADCVPMHGQGFGPDLVWRELFGQARDREWGRSTSPTEGSIPHARARAIDACHPRAPAPSPIATNTQTPGQARPACAVGAARGRRHGLRDLRGRERCRRSGDRPRHRPAREPSRLGHRSCRARHEVRPSCRGLRGRTPLLQGRDCQRGHAPGAALVVVREQARECDVRGGDRQRVAVSPAELPHPPDGRTDLRGVLPRARGPLLRDGVGVHHGEVVDVLHDPPERRRVPVRIHGWLPDQHVPGVELLRGCPVHPGHLEPKRTTGSGSPRPTPPGGTTPPSSRSASSWASPPMLPS